MSLLKRVMAPKTINKIRCFGSQEEWGKVLLEEIDPEALGTVYGGKVVRMVDGKEYTAMQPKD
jgi:hypothetical protein